MHVLKDVLIVGYIPAYSRQGADLNDALNGYGIHSTLVQFGVCNDSQRRMMNAPYLRPRVGPLSKWIVLINEWALFVRAISIKHAIVVGVGSPSIFVCAVIKILRRTKFIYYALEFAESKSTIFLLRHFCDGIINVEETRQNLLGQLIGSKKRSLILYNMPRKTELNSIVPQMRNHLIKHNGISASTKLIMYAGSYQRYSRLESIVTWAEKLPENTKLVLMVFNLPESVSLAAGKSVIVLPEQPPESFYSWFVDADVALLPYEDEVDKNIYFCSPQKLFDCLAVGVPFIGSKRPLIETIIKETGVGITADFRDEDDFLRGIKKILGMDQKRLREKALKAHLKFNYDARIQQVIDFLFAS